MGKGSSGLVDIKKYIRKQEEGRREWKKEQFAKARRGEPNQLHLLLHPAKRRQAKAESYNMDIDTFNKLSKAELTSEQREWYRKFWDHD